MQTTNVIRIAAQTFVNLLYAKTVLDFHIIENSFVFVSCHLIYFVKARDSQHFNSSISNAF